jgi:hypothetical protein
MEVFRGMEVNINPVCTSELRGERQACRGKGPASGMDMEGTRKCLYCRGSNPGHAAQQPVTVLTELSRLARK